MSDGVDASSDASGFVRSFQTVMRSFSSSRSAPLGTALEPREADLSQVIECELSGLPSPRDRLGQPGDASPGNLMSFRWHRPWHDSAQQLGELQMNQRVERDRRDQSRGDARRGRWLRRKGDGQPRSRRRRRGPSGDRVGPCWGPVVGSLSVAPHPAGRSRRLTEQVARMSSFAGM